jgi:hypothetical protein
LTVARSAADGATGQRDGIRVATGRVMAAYTAIGSSTGLGLYLVLGLHERLFTDWVIQVAVIGLVVAALTWPLVARQPRNGAVWALLWLAVLCATQALAVGLLQRDLAALGLPADPAQLTPRELPLTTALLHQTVSWTWVAGNVCFAVALLLFPDGKLPSPRWRRVTSGVLAAGVLAIAIVAWLARPTSTVASTYGGWPAEASSAVQAAVGTALSMAIATVLVGFAALVARYRGSSGEVRAQLRWIAWAAALLVVEGLVLFPLQYTPVGSDLYRYTSLVTFAIFLAAYVVAIARYRLYDIDRLISRTVGYGLVTVLLAGIYVGSVLAAQAVLGTTSGERPATVVAGSTLLVAALFGPVRRRAQRMVDRRFNRRVHDATDVVAAFGERLRDEIELESLIEDLRTTAAAVAEPISVTIWTPRPPHRS